MNQLPFVLKKIFIYPSQTIGWGSIHAMFRVISSSASASSSSGLRDFLFILSLICFARSSGIAQPLGILESLFMHY